VLLEFESEGDDLFAKPGDVVFVGAADLLDQAVKPEAPEQPRDLAAGLSLITGIAGQTGTSLVEQGKRNLWALRELRITWIPAHSPQAKGRVERNFGTAPDRLVKGMRVAGVKTIGEANRYLQEDYLVWWERELTVEPANHDDAHRRLEKSHNLAASLSHVEMRQVRNDCTLRFEGGLYQIERQAIVRGLRGANVRVEKRLDGSMAAPPVKQAGSRSKSQQRGSDWNKNFDLKKGPKIWQAAQESGYQRSVAE